VAATCDDLERRVLFAVAPTVTSFTLINADTDQPIVGFAPLVHGATIDLSALPTRRLNIRANVGSGVKSVQFGYDANGKYIVENGGPYALGGNRGTDFFAWTPSVGAHTVQGTAYSLAGAAGTVGPTLSVGFKVVSGSTAPAVTISAPDSIASETSGNTGTIVVTRTGSTARALTVNLSVGGTATEGADYRAIARHVTIAAGSSKATLTIAAVDDTSSEGSETVIVSALAGAGYVLGGVVSATMTLADNEAPRPQPDPAADHRYLYVFDAPKNREGFYDLKPQIEVFDIDNGHRWVKNIPLPAKIYNIRGVAASPATGKLYVSYFLSPKTGAQPGGLLCMDLNTNDLLWRRDYAQSLVPAPDRFDITPDGKKIYMPSGEFGTSDLWIVIDANNGKPIGKIRHTTSPHNAIVSADGRYAFLEGQEKGTQDPKLTHTVAVVDTATDRVVKKVGPFQDVVRPFTINGTGSLIFATTNNFIGFQVADVSSGGILYTVAPPGVRQPGQRTQFSHSHGIALTPDEKKLYVVDTIHTKVHVWNVSAVKKGIAPKYLGAISTRKQGRNLSGQVDPAASNDTSATPSWLAMSYDGRYLYPESGEIIDMFANKVIGQLRSKTVDADGRTVLAPYTHSRYILEVDVADGRVVRTTNQFGIGRVQ
jgi:hypothetical protein